MMGLPFTLVLFIAGMLMLMGLMFWEYRNYFRW